MAWNGQNTMTAAVAERGFTLDSDGREVPGVYWSPVGREVDRMVLLGHGGTFEIRDDAVRYLDVQLAKVLS